MPAAFDEKGFRRSVRSVFEEAERHGCGSPDHVREIARQLLGFLEECEKAKGRPAVSCRVRLPTGGYSSKRVCLPRQALILDAATKRRLRDVHHRIEFSGILYAFLHANNTKQMTPKKDKDKKKSAKRPRYMSSSTSPEVPLRLKQRKKAQARKHLPQHARSTSPGVAAKRRKVFSDDELEPNDAKLLSASQRLQSSQASKELGDEGGIDEGSGQVALHTVNPASRNWKIPVKSNAELQLTVRAKTSPPSQQRAATAQPQTPKTPPRNAEDKDGEYNGSSDADDSVDGTTSPGITTSPMNLDEDDQNDDCLDHDLETLVQMVSHTTEAQWGNKDAIMQWLVAGHKGVQEDCQVQPGHQNRVVARLDNLLRHCQERVAAVDAERWPSHLANLQRFCASAAVHNMNYQQRLLKIVDMLLIPEELDAVAKEDWGGLEKILGLCSVIAEVMGPEPEVIDEQVKNYWIAAKKMDISSLKKLMAAKKRVAEQGL